MVQAAEPHEALSEALTKLETSLLTPVISGELASWVQAAQAATVELGRQLKAYLGSTQRRQYGEIARSDAELLACIQQLAQEDRNLLDACAQFDSDLDKLLQMVSVANKHESRAEEQRADVEQQGIALIVRIRKHQVAADTWLAEAHYRDRGTGD